MAIGKKRVQNEVVIYCNEEAQGKLSFNHPDRLREERNALTFSLSQFKAFAASSMVMTPLPKNDTCKIFSSFSALGISQNKIAHDIGVTPRRINEIVLGRRSITADTAIRLAYYFGTSEEFWMGLQDNYELEKARDSFQGRLKTIIHPLHSPAHQ